MALLVTDCPRCDAKAMTFDVLGQVWRYREYNWQDHFEVFAVCRHCSRPTVYLLSLKSYNEADAFRKSDALVKFTEALNDHFKVERFISIRDHQAEQPPEYLPADIEGSFNEGATCLSVACHNAAATMFRLCVDIATRPLLPNPDDATTPQPNSKQRRDLGLRLPWLFEQGLLPAGLKDLASCIKEDGNDGAHAGTLTKEDAEDLLDFTSALLERLYTEPARIALAAERRAQRRQGVA